MAPRPMNEDQIRHALLNVPALVAEEIKIKQIYYPTAYSTTFDTKPWEFGVATSKKQVMMIPNLPEVERDFKEWRDLSGAQSGCEGCPPPGCFVKPTKIGGHAFVERVTSLMARDYESEEFCIEEIQNTADFDKMFTQIVDNLANTMEYIKEHSIAANYMRQISTKLVVDSEGIKGNRGDPFSFPNVGTARLSKINPRIFNYLYSLMRKMPGMVPADSGDGKPLFNVMISEELKGDMYRGDPTTRKDMHYSQDADDLVKKLAPTENIMGQFIPWENQWPSRFVIVDGDVREVLPHAPNVKGSVGFYATTNPAYLNATHESVMFYPMTPLTVYTRGNVTSLPGGMQFGDQPSFFEKFEFNNIKDKLHNRWQSKGFLMTKATIGLDFEHIEAVIEVLFERAPTNTLASFHPLPEEVPTVPTVTNIIPATGCPCPEIKSVVQSPANDGTFFITFHRAVEADANDVLELGLLRGGFVRATVVSVGADGRFFTVTMPAGVDIDTCSKFTSLFCVNNLECYSQVIKTVDCRAGIRNAVDVYLLHPLKAFTATNILFAKFKDGTTANMEIVSADLTTNIYSIKYATGYGPNDNSTGSGAPTTLNEGLVCDRGGLESLCVPTSTVAACPGCDASNVTVVPCD